MARKSISGIRHLVLEKTSGVCDLCGLVLRDWDAGHKVDHCVGGTEDLDNLVPMCPECNLLKPVHHTEEEYQEYKRYGHLAYLFSKVYRMLGYPTEFLPVLERVYRLGLNKP